MRPDSLIITRAATLDPPELPGIDVQSFESVRGQLLANPFRCLGRYRDIELRTVRWEVLPNPLKTAIVMRLMARGACSIRDEQGGEIRLNAARFGRLASGWLRDRMSRGRLLEQVRCRVRQLQQQVAAAPRTVAVEPTGRPVYLRTDLCFGLRSGGSVGHIAGVLNHLESRTRPPLFLSSDRIPTVNDDIDTVCLQPDTRYWDFAELASFQHNFTYGEQIEHHTKAIRPSFIYQRYSLNNLNGVELARRHRIPFVLEYNGSEVWIARNWGRPLKYEALSLEIEELNLRAADLIVVVSEPMREELVSRGVPDSRILVNPNGVNAEMYRPEIDGTPVRQRHGLANRTVLGFIGTFGPWHGAEVLAEAFGRLVRTRPDLGENAHLMMIGDGARMTEVREAVARHGCADRVTLTGLIPQCDGPVHLAACDLLVSPHVPNPDGTPFFGSPTKLFEYMAMGRGIVASDLDQIGQILKHGESAWMVTPGHVDELALGLQTLIEDPQLAARLGRSARETVVDRYTWLAHTERILDALHDRCPQAETRDSRPAAA